MLSHLFCYQERVAQTTFLLELIRLLQVWTIVSDSGALCSAPFGELGVVVVVFDRCEALQFIRWWRSLQETLSGGEFGWGGTSVKQ